MARSEFEKRVAEANRELRNRVRNRVLGAPSSEGVRFELYHGAPSLCSHKVRTTLFEKNVPFVSHDMNILPIGRAVPENYRPGYVRLRMMGAEGETFARGYTGRTSVATEGFDACVVPTLVDHERQRVVVDSNEICRYLAREAEGGPDLVPTEQIGEVERQIAIVDAAPHPAIIYGPTPGGDHRPKLIAGAMTGVHDRKVVAIEKMITKVENDPELIEAYRCKIAKELGGKQFVVDPNAMRGAVDEMAGTIESLEKQLSNQAGEWVCGERFTLADVMWATHLFRLKWDGFGYLWEGRRAPGAGDSKESHERPHVADYFDRATARPAFRKAVVDWPGGNAPSPFVPELATVAARLRFLAGMVRRMDWRGALFG